MSAFKGLAEIQPQQVWNGILGRVVEGESMTFGVLELAPGAVAATHQHPNEQIGIVLRGSLTFTIGGETRELGTGDTYNIPGGVVHQAVAGAEGAVVIDTFAPVRSDWATHPKLDPRAPIWP